MKIVNVVGARPNFMKIAPILEVMRRTAGLEPVLVHTGQHYDTAMSKLFFEDLGIPKPDHELNVGSATHAVQTARIMELFERTIEAERPDLVLVVGDVNSTVACALTAVKLGVRVAHVEAGLRSFDRTMPEEINRVVTDAISDLLFVTERGAVDNLHREGIPSERIHLTGNVMIDSLLRHRKRADESEILRRFALDAKSYGVLTLHRPANVDAPEVFAGILRAVGAVAEDLPVVFPCHPRTRQRIQEFGLGGLFQERNEDGARGVVLCEPLGYLDFLKLMAEARLVFTDSGGIQEETTILRVPCITLRENTERPVTIHQGTNRLAGRDPDAILRATREALESRWDPSRLPELWDGKAAERIVEVLIRG
jgi:UDP-N-acetylglucosamine 2-epimerase (non-hydrolysing)